jgi:tRNA G18 (ribose-2'-O)-methylase SpoU
MDTRPLNVRSEYQDLPVTQLKSIQISLTNNVSILLFNVRTDGNIGMIIRQACIMGCKRVIICGRKGYDRRFTVGSHNYIEIIYSPEPLRVTIDTISPGVFKETVEYDTDSFIELIKEYTPVFLEQGGTDIQQTNWRCVENPLLILGNESLGIPQHIIKTVKKKINQTLSVSIPQRSVLRSMNVAMAASIALWEITKG